MIIVFKCPIKSCKHGKKPKHAEVGQCRIHLLGHDYMELHRAAFALGLLEDILERRDRSWLADTIISACMIPIE